MKKYSIILPVRNGGIYIEECLNSILAQRVQDFEIIVLENCSTDNTVDILNSFNDNRIKIYQASHSLSIEENWHRIISIPKGEFITLIGHDDKLDETYLAVMDDLIREHPQASLYQTHFRYIDSTGKETGKCKPMQEAQQPATALHNFLCDKISLMGTGFMMRSADYDQVGGIPQYPNLLFADMELWIELSRKSYMAASPRECFSYRRHTRATTSSSSDAKFLQAFGLLIDYLAAIKKEDPILGKVVDMDSVCLLRQYCQGITHKVLRTPHSKRQTPSVAAIIEQFRAYGNRLSKKGFDPLSVRKIKAGKIIDNNKLLHSLFLLFKKVYKQPLIKS